MRLMTLVLLVATGTFACGGSEGETTTRVGPTGVGGGGGGSGGAGSGPGGSSTTMAGPGGGGTGAGTSCSEAGTVTYATPTTEDVSFTSSSDGVEIFGRLHIPEAGSSFATVILLHQYCSDLTDWSGVSTLAPDLAEAGFLVFHYDARGFGQSNAGGTLDYCNESSAVLFEPMVADVGDAIAFLETRTEANLDCLAVAGGSMGANVSLIYAASDDRVLTTVLFSPGLNYLGLSTQTATGQFHPREALMFATEEDTYSANTLITLEDLSSAITTVTLPGDAHGASILAAHPDALAQTLDWLGDRL